MIVRSCKEIKHHKWVFISIELGYYVKDRSLVRNKERGGDSIVFNICHNCMFCCELFNDAGH
jgi:hypothetical protein